MRYEHNPFKLNTKNIVDLVLFFFHFSPFFFKLFFDIYGLYWLYADFPVTRFINDVCSSA